MIFVATEYDQRIKDLTKEYNVAVANGLVQKAFSIGRQIISLEAKRSYLRKDKG